MFLLNKQGDLKKITIERKDEFCTKDERLPMLFQHLKDSGAKTFLLTNSEWWYTDAVMSYFYSLMLCHCNIIFCSKSQNTTDYNLLSCIADVSSI